jgi:hypothetical protein
MKQQIKQIIKENPNGFSVNLSDLTPIKAENDIFCIAITDNRQKEEDNAINDILKASELFTPIKSRLVLGGWFDVEHKKYCLDLVILERSRDKALFLAETFNQKAIFNLKTFEEIKNLNFKQQQQLFLHQLYHKLYL